MTTRGELAVAAGERWSRRWCSRVDQDHAVTWIMQAWGRTATSPSAPLEMVVDDVAAHRAAERLALLGREPEVDAGSHA